MERVNDELMSANFPPPGEEFNKYAKELFKWVTRMGKEQKLTHPIMYIIDADQLEGAIEMLFTFMAAAASCQHPQIIIARNNKDEQLARNNKDEQQDPTKKTKKKRGPTTKKRVVGQLTLGYIQQLIRQHAPTIAVTTVVTPVEGESTDAICKLLFDRGRTILTNDMKPSERQMQLQAGSLWQCANDEYTQIVLLTADTLLAKHAIALNDCVRLVVTNYKDDTKWSGVRKEDRLAIIPGDPAVASPADWSPFEALCGKQCGHWTDVFNRLMDLLKSAGDRKLLEIPMLAPGNIWALVSAKRVRGPFAHSQGDKRSLNLSLQRYSRSASADI